MEKYNSDIHTQLKKLNEEGLHDSQKQEIESKITDAKHKIK
jgi:hypothetical protein